jgi:hypothetical protein
MKGTILPKGNALRRDYTLLEMSLAPCLIAVTACVAAPAEAPAARFQDPPAQAGRSAEAAIAARLADGWTREGFLVLEPADVVPADLACGLAMFRAAAELKPDDPAMWRHLVQAAQLAGPIMPDAEDLGRTALATLAKLAPDDQVVRLQRIVDAVEQRNTAEDRIAAFRAFLAPDVVKSIGAPVAARLAFDVALLESRRGNMDAFAQDVALALSLSPAFPAAAQAAAGFFAERSDDPIGQAELLVTAAMADPGDERTLQRLGNLLLQYGAYGSAARVYRMAGDAASAAERSQNVQDVIATDAALALWMSGRPADAIELMRRRSQRRAAAFLESVMQQNPTLTRTEAAAIPPMVPAVAASMEIALLRALGDDASATVGHDRLLKGTVTSARLSLEQEPPMTTVAAESLLEAANALALLGGTEEQVRSLVTAADKVQPLTEQAKARFEAWILLNSGQPAKALELFAANASGDAVTAYGTAMAETAAGDRQKGMRALLELARNARSVLPGALAAEEVRRATGVAVPAEDVAARLDAVVAGIPPSVDSMLAGSDRALGLIIEPVAVRSGPFDPVLVDVRVQNRTSIPMAIDAQGPIERTVAVVPRISTTGASNVIRFAPLVVPIDRVLELGGGQAVTVRVNLMWFAAGRRLVVSPLDGAQVGLRGSLNFLAMPGSVRHGSLGTDAICEMIRVDGVPRTPEWLAESIAMVGGAFSEDAVVRTALLLHVSESAEFSETDRAQARDAAVAAFVRWPAPARAWIALVAPAFEVVPEEFLKVAYADPDPQVRAATLVVFATDPRQAEVTRALESDDAFERTVAEAVVSRFDRERARVADRLRMGGPPQSGPMTEPPGSPESPSGR